MINIIWDLDGTLIDSSKEINQCLELAVKKSGLDLSKQIKPFIIGPTIDKIVKESFPLELLTDEILKNTIGLFRKIYDNSDFNYTKPYIGIEEIIFDKTNYCHHIVTNKPDMPTNRILNKFKWSGYITSVRTPYSNMSSLNKRLQSKTELFSELIIKFGNEVSSFIGIGDMRSDCTAARENNITAVGVLWGTGTREELLDCCDYLFEDTKQLRDYLYENK
jgi:phosphoglycolate phosphatase